jgi:hypothetical protein
VNLTSEEMQAILEIYRDATQATLQTLERIYSMSTEINGYPGVTIRIETARAKSVLIQARNADPQLYEDKTIS